MIAGSQICRTSINVTELGGRTMLNKEFNEVETLQKDCMSQAFILDLLAPLIGGE